MRKIIIMLIITVCVMSVLGEENKFTEMEWSEEYYYDNNIEEDLPIFDLSILINATKKIKIGTFGGGILQDKRENKNQYLNIMQWHSGSGMKLYLYKKDKNTICVMGVDIDSQDGKEELPKVLKMIKLEKDKETIRLYEKREFLIIASVKNKEAALKIAEEASKKMGIKYIKENTLEKTGIFISVENTDLYNEMRKGYYIVVVEKQSETKIESIEKVRKYYKDCYIKATRVCIGIIK